MPLKEIFGEVSVISGDGGDGVEYGLYQRDIAIDYSTPGLEFWIGPASDDMFLCDQKTVLGLFFHQRHLPLLLQVSL